MNLYETLGAPPTLSSKDLSMHIKMMPSTLLSKEQRTQYGGELLNPKTRLYNELKTLRFPPRPGPEEINSLYKKVCQKLSHASGEPIPYRFFKAEFQQLLEDCGYTKHSSLAELTETTLNNAIDQITDIWRFQGYAALLLRIAENSELSDPKNAHRAWLAALKAYQRFFATADVKDSCAYRTQTEEKFRQDCREAWDGFLAEQLEGVSQRMKRYIQKNNADGVGACMQTLQLSIVKTIAPALSKSAMQDSLLPYASAIQTAASLAAAGAMFNNCPKTLLAQDARGECKRAMIGALKKATDQLLAGDADIAEIIRWANTLNVKELYQKGALLVKKDAGDFFEACAKFIRSVIQDHKFDRTKEMELLVTILPADFVIAKSDKEDLKQDDMLGYGVLMYLNDMFEKEVTEKMSESAAKLIGRRAYRMIDESIPEGAYRDATLGKVNRIMIVQLQKKNVSGESFLAFIDIFPGNWPIDSPQVHNFRELKEGMIGDPLIAQALKLLKEAREASPGTYTHKQAVRALIDFACANPGIDLGREDLKFKQLVDQTLIQAFVGSVNAYMESKTPSRAPDPFDLDPFDVLGMSRTVSTLGYAEDVIKLCGSFLPRRSKLPTEGKMNLTTDSLMEKLDITKDETLVKRRKKYDRSRVKKKTRQKKTRQKKTKERKTEKEKTKKEKPKQEKPKPTYTPSRFSRPTHTKINGIKFRGGSVSAGIQYFIWMLVLPALAVYALARMPIRSYDMMVMRFFFLRSALYIGGALLLSGVFGLMANSDKGRISGFGKAARGAAWMTAILLILLYASYGIWRGNVFLRVVLAIWAFISLLTMKQQIKKNAYYDSNTITIDAITYNGGGIAVFFNYITTILIVPCIIASLIYIFDWELSPGWIFVFKLYGIALALGVLRAFFICLAEESGVRRFANFMSTEIYMLILPVCGWYSINYFDAFPLKWWIIALYSVYGLIFLLGTIAAAQRD
jgi:hypothetical protein